MQNFTKRKFLAAAGIGLGFGVTQGAGAQMIAPADGAAAGERRRDRQQPQAPTQNAKTTVMFETPKGFGGLKGAPNALAMDERGRGLWYADQEGPQGGRKNNEAILVDFTGKELKRLHTPADNASGMAQGGGFIWIGSSDKGFYQVNIDTNEIVYRDHPMTPPGNPSRATHGMAWDDDSGKLWAADPQMGVITRMDPKTFVADRIIKSDNAHFSRVHGLGYHAGFLYQCGWRDNKPDAPSTRYDMGHGGLVKYDINTGLPVLYIDFLPNSIDNHGVAIDKAGKIYVCDSGFHPNIPDRTPPTSGDIGFVTLL